MNKMLRVFATLLLLAGLAFGTLDSYGPSGFIHEAGANDDVSGVVILKFTVVTAPSGGYKLRGHTRANAPTCTTQPYFYLYDITSAQISNEIALTSGNNDWQDSTNFGPITAGDVIKLVYAGGSGCPASNPVDLNVQILQS